MSYEVAGTLKDYFSSISATLENVPLDRISGALAVLDGARMRGSRVYIFGNGGSAATASHFACDLTKGAICSGAPKMKVHALVDNTPVFSAWGNDAGYETVFAEQLRGIIEPGDIAVAISGSGNSPNVLEGVKVARESGAITVGFSGFDGGKLPELVDIAIVVPNQCMEQVEDIHLALTHAMAICLRQMHSKVMVVTKDPQELEEIARGYLEGGRYWKTAQSYQANKLNQTRRPSPVTLQKVTY